MSKRSKEAWLKGTDLGPGDESAAESYKRMARGEFKDEEERRWYEAQMPRNRAERRHGRR